MLTSLEMSIPSSLVAMNLKMAMQSLRKVSDEKQRHQEADTSGNSTRCTSLDSLPDYSDIMSQSSETSSLGAMKHGHKVSGMQGFTFVVEVPVEQLQFYNLADNLFHEGSDGQLQ